LAIGKPRPAVLPACPTRRRKRRARDSAVDPGSGNRESAWLAGRLALDGPAALIKQGGKGLSAAPVRGNDARAVAVTVAAWSTGSRAFSFTQKGSQSQARRSLST